MFIKQELNIPYEIVDLFKPSNWLIMSPINRENIVHTLLDFIGKELKLTDKYQIEFLEQDGISEATFNENKNPPSIELNSKYLIYGFDVMDFAHAYRNLFIPKYAYNREDNLDKKRRQFYEQVSKNKSSFAQRVLSDKNMGLIPTGTLFQTCIHEMEHVRQHDVEQIPKMACPYKKGTPTYNDFMQIHNNSIHNIYKISYPKIPFLKSYVIGFLPASKTCVELDENLHNYLHQIQYAERQAYFFAEVNMYKNFIPYFESNGYDTKLLVECMKKNFNYDFIIQKLESCYNCHGIQTEFDKIMGDLENVKITPNNKKLYKYVVSQLCKATKGAKREKKVCL